jgi:hypothetical protein
MVLSKHERVIRTLELEEPDMIPIFYQGFEPTGPSYQYFKQSEEYKKYKMYIENDFSKVKYQWAGDITEARFWNSDCHMMDPWGFKKFKMKVVPAPPEYPECVMYAFDGRIWKRAKQAETGLPYDWYIDGYFRTSEIVYSYWEKYGKPSELINDNLDYSPQIWDNYVKSLEPYFYPIASLPMSLHESLFEGMTLARVKYNMRKNPQFIHEFLNEFTKANLEIIRRLAEAGIDIVFYLDDLGYKGRSILSIEDFKTFILPYYKQIYQECTKKGMFVLQHSCGYIDRLLPHMVDAGLNGIQALEPAAGVDLAYLKETFGDYIAFLGGMDASDVLNFGTPKDVGEEVKRCIKIAAPRGGYFAGPSHNILNMPWENVLALRAAIEKYRNYPL